jgi:competence protein ComEA
VNPVNGRSRAQIAAYVAVAVLLLLAGWRYLERRADEGPAPTVALDEGAAGATSGAVGRSAEQVFVHVAGAVKDPGLYRLPAGLRVGAAIHRAGGTTVRADLAAVNLAGEVQDGQQVLVPVRGAAPPATAATSSTSTTSTTSSTGAAAAPISLAQATPEQLDAAVEGIGPTLAAAIIEFRDEHGTVSSIDELAEVDGIGETRLGALREALVP